jgi:hypothetical protein
MHTCLIRGAFNTLVNRVQLAAPANMDGISSPSAFNSPNQSTFQLSSSPEAVEPNYPNVQFWRRSQWKAHIEKLKGVSDPASNGATVRGKTAVSQGENISTLYIEDENGHPVDGHRLTAIRKVARAIWNKFADIGQAPTTWGKANSTFITEYRREMRHQFPELRLCENDWKSELLATENYPSWYSNQCRAKGNTERSSRSDKGKKRPPNQATDEADQAVKKQRIEQLPECVTAEVGIHGASSSVGLQVASGTGVVESNDENTAEPKMPPSSFKLSDPLS